MRSGRALAALTALTGLALLAAVRGQRSRVGPQRPLHPCEKSSCYPATGNLLIGREALLKASSTCGLQSQERYCIVSHLEERKKCFRCDSRPHTENAPALNHKISNIVFRHFPGTRSRSWWQSRNGVENVTISLALEAEFHFTHLIIVFKTFRPAAMLVERSFDFGKTWRVYRYFAHNCQESFPGIPQGNPSSLTQVVCESKYSNVAPSTGGEVILRILPTNIVVDNPYSQEVQNLLKMTNLRINFTRLHTLGDDLLDDRAEIQEKYYYAITDMTVRGSCSCYGHASRCLPMPGVESKMDMVHGRCECTHNTKGLNCELCEDFFNDLPWKPALGRTTNACQRCNCNNHASACHFDPAVYESSGKVSGGVCDDCRHNTMGENCQKCKPFFYRDPDLDVQDPEACKPCDCDPRGSLEDAICDDATDLATNAESGRCHCKTNVEGRRCDTCKNGFWNFSESDDDGCQACTCNPLGTIDNRGCDVYTGECICKRNVVGRDCNQCPAEFWGLADDEDGCRRCDCDVGGSLDNNCDVETGQCRCRPNVQGRRCEQPGQHFFAAALDNLVYEAELSECASDPDVNAINNNCQVANREPFRGGAEDSWTGPGFMRVFEDDVLRFTIDDITTSMDYNIVIRYEPNVPLDWEEVNVVVEREENVDLDGPCANSESDGVMTVVLPRGERRVTVTPSVCFEEGKTYAIRIEMKRQRSDSPNPRASVLIDSIVLEPNVRMSPIYTDPANQVWRKNMERDGCDVYVNSVDEDVPENCKEYVTSIAFYVFNGAQSCRCDQTGSTSYECKQYRGNCPCKDNVVGRRCDKCATGTYGFGPDGCKPCDCNNIGALDNFCDYTTGQCKCRPNTYGRQCDQCQPGYWNFPNCLQCECNGHADVCDSKTGECTDCRDDTLGHKCETCVDGFYGDPKIGKDIPCRPCPCPGTVGSNHSYALTCNLDVDDVVCDCQDGYAEPRCDVCSDNYYGRPETPGGSCSKCECNDNIDIRRPGNCDHETGKCLKCLYDTDGDHCEKCRLGYHGDALAKNCEMCVCEILGTNSSMGACDQVTGQCPCFKNVIGLECNTCLKNHWKLASGEGCDFCDCDEVGSNSEQCNVYDGQCDCKPGFGGRQCNQCQANFWGDPKEQCQPCDCDSLGSATPQCRRDTGACVCNHGIGGYRCNECARGFYGDYCSACGECFDNWDRIISNLDNSTKDAIGKAGKIQRVGSTGAYAEDFDEMSKNLKSVEHIVKDTTKGNSHVDAFENKIKNTKNIVNSTEKLLIDFNTFMANAVTRINIANVSVDRLGKNCDDLKNKVGELAYNSTKLQEAILEGALNLTREAKERATRAADRADKTELILGDTQRHIISTEKLVDREYKDFNKTQKDNDKNIIKLQEILNELESEIPELNHKMCGSSSNSCALCGGASCNKCGGLACEQGSITVSKQALDYANKTDYKIREREQAADNLLRGIIGAKVNSTAAFNISQKTFNNANAYKDATDGLIKRSSKLKLDLEEFLSDSGTTPADVRSLAEHIMNLSINFTPEQLTKLVDEIRETAYKITNIERIIDETRQSLAAAKELKDRSLLAKDDANLKLNQTTGIVDALAVAAEAQEEAAAAIKIAAKEIEALKKLPSVQEQLEGTKKQSDVVNSLIDSLNKRLQTQENNFFKISEDVNQIAKDVNKIVNRAEKTHQQARELENKYNMADGALNDRVNKSADSREKAQNLLRRATKLAADTQAQLKTLQSMEDLYNSHTSKLKSMEDAIKNLNMEMKGYLATITERSQHYRQCSQ